MAKGKLLHLNITETGYMVVIQDKEKDVTLTSKMYLSSRRPDVANDSINTTWYIARKTSQDQQYTGTKAPVT